MPLSGPVGTPLLGGVAIVFPDFSVSSLWKPNSRGKPQKTKEFKECGVLHPHAFYATPPPLSLYRKKHAAPRNMKNTPDLAPQTGSENRVARYVE